MPIDPECQAIADRIVALRADLEARRANLASTAPGPRWEQGFAAIDAVRRDLDGAIEDFDACLAAHQRPADLEVEVFDLTHGPTSGMQVTAWRLSGGAAQAVQTEPVVNGHASIPMPMPELGLTVEPAGGPPSAIDFRSGWLQQLPRRDVGDATTRVEIVVAQPLSLDRAELDAWLAAVGLPYETTGPIGTTGGTLRIRVDTLRVDLEPQRIVVNSTGEAKATTLVGSTSATYRASAAVSVSLLASPDPTTPAEVRAVGDPTLQLDGPAVALLQPVMPFLRSLIANEAAAAIRTALARDVPTAVAASFGLEALPDGATVSLRSLDISPAGMRLQPTIGAFGYILSRFVP